jgi:hypothetical protein
MVVLPTRLRFEVIKVIPSLPIAALAGLLAGLAFTAAVAQEASQALGPDFDYLPRPSDRRLPLPEYPNPQKTPGFVLPPAPKPDSEAKQLSFTLVTAQVARKNIAFPAGKNG